MNQLEAKEVFVEGFAPAHRLGVPFYYGSGPERIALEPVLYRLCLDEKTLSVKWELLATFHARLDALEESPEGRSEDVVVIVGQGWGGGAFAVRCPLRWITSGDYDDAQKFLKVFYSTPSTGCSYVVPGRLMETVRAIMDLSIDMIEPPLLPGRVANWWHSGRGSR